MEWFTADTHFEHKNIIKHCNRPFSNIKEMNEIILDNINSTVAPEDTLYHLGDFAWKFKNIIPYRRRIRCRNVVLLLGNHDPHTLSGQPTKGLLKIFNNMVYTMLEIRPLIGAIKQPTILCHYAMRKWNRSHRGAWNLFGHSHGQLPDFRKLHYGVN